MLFAAIFTLFHFTFAEPYKILAVLPATGKSHYAIPDPLLVRLAEKGHQVTVYSPYPKKQQNITNYIDIDIGSCFSEPHDIMTMETMHYMASNALNNLLMFSYMLPTRDSIAQCDPLQKLLNSNEKYDLFITENFHSDFTLIFANKFKVPFITCTPNVMFPWLSDRMGNPNNPSYIPDLQIGFLPKMTFLERLQNSLLYVVSFVWHNYYSLGNAESISRDVLGPTASSIREMIEKVSMMFICVNTPINAPIPLVPAVVDIGGIHIKDVARLPKVCIFVD